MLTFIASVIASLAILFGSTVPAQDVQQQAPATMQQQAAAAQQTPQDAAQEADAWDTVDAYGISNPTGREMSLSYVRSESIGVDPTDILTYREFTLQSLTDPNTFHIYVWDEVHHA